VAYLEAELAEPVAATLGKGARLYAEGALHVEKWRDQQTGEPRSDIKIRAWRVEPIGQIGERRPERQKEVA
jgi:single-stranded DNA-binding protein